MKGETGRERGIHDFDSIIHLFDSPPKRVWYDSCNHPPKQTLNWLQNDPKHTLNWTLIQLKLPLMY